ncbi:MAG TPA: hypothetical protein VLN49_19785 [Gemmatimonadaceae bacterium]|nr:hypothetical protein [Gemmatimonadaceae bacterium]
MSDTPDRPTARQLLRAIVIAPLIAPVACAVLLVGIEAAGRWFANRSTSLSGLGFLAAMVLMVAIPVTYGATLALGAPAYLLLRRLGVATRWTLWITAALIGAILSRFIAPQLRGELITIPFPWWAGAAFGLLTAEAFWRLASSAR